MANNQSNNGLTISQGTFTDEVVTENSFIFNLMQKPAISGLIPLLYPKYSLVNVKSPLTSEAAEFVGDIKYRYGVLGRLERAVTMTGYKSGSFAVNVLSIIELLEDFVQPNSTLRFPSGDQIIIQGKPSQSATGWLYPCKVITGTKGNSFVFDTTQIQNGVQLGALANKFPEFSKRGYGNLQYPDWMENYLTIVRKAQECSGTAGTAITWLNVDEVTKYWIPGPSVGANGFMGVMGGASGSLLYQQEKEAWFGKATVDNQGNVTLNDVLNDNRPLYSGSGVYEQIPSGMNFGYQLGKATADGYWIDFVSQFLQASGNMEAEIFVDCGTGFVNQWTKSMWRYLDQSHAIAGNYPIGADRDVTIGQSTKRYFVNDCWITINENPVFSDPVLFPEVDANTGLPVFSYNAVFTNKGRNDGVPVIQKFAKAGRELIYKTLPGMFDPTNPKSIMAANAADGWGGQWLAEGGWAVRVPNQIAKVTRTDI